MHLIADHAVASLPRRLLRFHPLGFLVVLLGFRQISLVVGEILSDFAYFMFVQSIFAISPLFGPLSAVFNGVRSAGLPRVRLSPLFLLELLKFFLKLDVFPLEEICFIHVFLRRKRHF